jgi:hypothetical protein
LYGPAGTSSADVMVVLVTISSVRLGHVGDAAIAREGREDRANRKRQFITSIVTISILLRNGDRFVVATKKVSRSKRRGRAGISFGIAKCAYHWCEPHRCARKLDGLGTIDRLAGSKQPSRKCLMCHIIGSYRGPLLRPDFGFTETHGGLPTTKHR